MGHSGNNDMSKNVCCGTGLVAYTVFIPVHHPDPMMTCSWAVLCHSQLPPGMLCCPTLQV